MIRDEPVYNTVRNLIPIAELTEIDEWSRSFYTLEGHMESIFQFNKPLLHEPEDDLYSRAKQEVSDEIKHYIGRVNSLSFEDDIDLVPYESSSAAGFGYSGKKGEGNNLKRAKTILNAAVRTFSEQWNQTSFDTAVKFMIEQGTPDVAFTRTQLAKLPSIKVRNVFGSAFHNILIEGLSAAPLLAAFKSSDTFYVTGKDPTTYVPELLSKLDLVEGWFIVLDWRNFDASVQLWEIDNAFSCLERIIIFPTDLSYKAFIYARESFKTRKLAAPNGDLFLRIGGIPSGSYFTNLIGSIINYTRIRYICKVLEYEIIDCKVQGDDSIVKIKPTAKPKLTLFSDVGERLGWKLNLSKCFVTDRSDEVTFLGRSQLFLYNIRERLKILRLMCFPEFKVDDPKISTLRVRMIAKDAGYSDMTYNEVYLRLKRLYGEADELPARLRTFHERFDFQDVIM